MLEDHPIFATPVPVPEDLAILAKERGWPDELLQRALDARVPRGDIAVWLRESGPPVEQVVKLIEPLERFLEGPIRFREATWRDSEALVELYADAPEDVGDLEVIVERGPNPFAQFRLQEHPNIQVLDCRGVLLAAAAHAARNAIVDGERHCVHVMSAWRVRRDFRGYGLSRLLQAAPGPGASSWFGPITYWYERSGNASQGWLDKIRGEADTRNERQVAGLSATVYRIPTSSADARDAPSNLCIRAVDRADIPACVELINRTHDGLDFFRPYTCDFLESRLDDPFWGPKPSFWAQVYGWQDYAVAERNGRIVACAGLWDRGRDIRERWRHKITGEEQVVATAGLLDWGHAAGDADAMAWLIREMKRRTAELGRDQLLAPIEFAPDVRDVLDALGDNDARTDTRALRCMGFEEPGLQVHANVTKPYTDLAYW